MLAHENKMGYVLEYVWHPAIRILIMDGMTINHIVSIDHGSYDVGS